MKTNENQRKPMNTNKRKLMEINENFNDKYMKINKKRRELMKINHNPSKYKENKENFKGNR